MAVGLLMSGKRRRGLAAFLVMATLAAVLATPSLARAFFVWVGIDPVVQIGDHKLNIWIEWQRGYNCTIERDIRVRVAVPVNLVDERPEVISESNATMPCVDKNGQPTGRFNDVATRTNVKRDEPGRTVEVTTVVRATEDFPVVVRASVDGREVAVGKGMSNSRVVVDVPWPRGDRNWRRD